MKLNIALLFVILNSQLIPSALSMPIDWKGKFGVDTTIIDTYRKSDDPADTGNAQNNNTGTYGQDGTETLNNAYGGRKNAAFQTYILKLSPQMVINDSVSFIGELSTGYAGGGVLGKDFAQRSPKQDGTLDKSFGNALYMYNTSSGAGNVVFSKFYAELYSDVGTYQVGRHGFDWGLGALYNSGSKMWDRHTSIRDGITANFKLSNFTLSPFWSKVDSGTQLTKATAISEWGIGTLYNNPDKDLKFGVHFAKRSGHAQNSNLASGNRSGGTLSGGNNGSGTVLGDTSVKAWDFYLEKVFGPWKFATEVPFLNGDVGQVYNAGAYTKMKAMAVIIENTIAASEFWDLGLDLGHVTGEDENQSKYEAMYLHPNYQIANILYRYNLMAVTDADQNVFDSYIVNSKYAKARAQYNTDTWSFKSAIIYAIANEVPKAGQTGFDEKTNKSFDSVSTQEDDLGWEVDLGLDYRWNPNVVLAGDFGYHFVGDYYKFTNERGVSQRIDNSFMIQARMGLNF